MIGSGASTDSMMAASLGIIDSIISTTSTILITSTTSSLSATSAFHGGGVGAGVLRGVGARAIRTAITAGWRNEDYMSAFVEIDKMQLLAVCNLVHSGIAGGVR